MRCIICIQRGEWLAREGDVEELENVLVQQHALQEEQGKA